MLQISQNLFANFLRCSLCIALTAQKSLEAEQAQSAEHLGQMAITRQKNRLKKS